MPLYMTKAQIDAQQAKAHGHDIKRAQVIRKARRSKYEEYFAGQIKLYKLPEPVVEHRFHDTRKWRFDFAWPELMIAAEVEGVTSYGKNKDGSMKLGRHQSAKGYVADLEKYNTATVQGWSVLRYAQDEIKSGRAIEQLSQFIKMAENKA